MKLYELTRWGNDIDEFLDDWDTNYLVFAGNHVEASALVLGLEPNLVRITELGDCSGSIAQPHIYQGPFIGISQKNCFATWWRPAWSNRVSNIGAVSDADDWILDKDSFTEREAPGCSQCCAAPFKLYEATCFGELVDGNKMADTNYLVYATDHLDVARLSWLRFSSREVKIDLVVELAICNHRIETAAVRYLGAYESCALRQHARLVTWRRGTVQTDHNFNSLDFVFWLSDTCRGLEITTDYFDNGQLAARCAWLAGKRNGVSEYWFANGQLMHRGEYLHDEAHGLHEWWHESGALMYSGEFQFGERVAVHQRWFEDGAPDIAY